MHVNLCKQLNLLKAHQSRINLSGEYIELRTTTGIHTLSFFVRIQTIVTYHQTTQFHTILKRQ